MKTQSLFSVLRWAAAFCALFWLTSTAQAQQQFGIVDFQECATKSKLKQQLDVEFNALKQGLLGVFQKMKDGNAIFLTKAEMTELAGIYEKGDKANDAEKKKAGEIQTLADQRAGTLRRLEGTPNPTEADKKQLEKLTQSQQDGVQLLQQIGDDYQKRIEDKGKGFEEQLEKVVKDAVKKVAQEKNLALVFNANVVIYAAVDITEDVVKVLSK